MSARERHAEKKAKKKAERLQRQELARKATEAQREQGLAWPWPPLEEPEPDKSYVLERCLRAATWAAQRVSGEVPPAGNLLDAAQWQEVTREMCAASPMERAQALAFDAMEADDPDESRDLIRQALAIDPECLDAVSTLFIWKMPTDDDCIALEALLERYAQRPTVSQALADEDGKAWDRVQARPYLRLLIHLAQQAGRGGDFPVAFARIERLRRLSATHYDQLRAHHLAWLLSAGDLAAAQTLIAGDPENDQDAWCWLCVLARFLANDLPGARRAATRAEQVGHASLYDHLDGLQPDSRSANHELLHDLVVPAFQAHPAAWAFAQTCCRLTTPAQQEAAKASYAAPVARLLSLGRPQREASPETFVQRYGLGPADLPELLRLADDQAIHEYDQDDPAIFGPYHALEAITHLRPVTAVPSLMAMIPSHVHDEWMAHHLVLALARIGEAAVVPLVALLADLTQEVDVRILACNSLSTLAQDHPPHRQQIVTVMIDGLSRHGQQSIRLNASLAWALSDLSAEEALPLIEEAFNQGHLDPDQCPTWDELAGGLTLP